MLVLADLGGLTTAFVLAQSWASTGADGAAGVGKEYWLLATLPMWIVLAKLYGLYDRDEERTSHSTVDDLVGVFHLVTVGVWLVFAGLSVTGLASPELDKLTMFWVVAILLVVGYRLVARAYCRRHPSYWQTTVIVGAGDVGQLVAHKMLSHPEYGIRVLGFVDDDPKPRRSEVEGLDVLGSPADLPGLVAAYGVERVVVAFTAAGHEETLDLIRELREVDVQIDIVPRMFEVVGTQVGLHDVEGLPLVGLAPLRLSRSSRWLKRGVDLILAGVGLLILAPALALIALWIKLDSRGPVFFRQERVGLGDRAFRIFKFRTMCVDAEQRKQDLAHLNMHLGGDPRMFKIADDPRITKAGRVLRRYSLDELPQLINVLRGEMSLVGPRPLIHDEDRWVEDWARRRLELKPGVTGLWQVLGASDIPFEEMTRLDYLYVTNWSLWGDLRLVVQTLPALLRTRHAY